MTGQTAMGDEIEVTGDTFVAPGPSLLEVQVVPMVSWAAVKRMHVEIRYEDRDYVNSRDVMFSSQAAAPASVRIPIRDPRRRTYQWRQRIEHADGTITESSLRSADQAVLVAEPLTHDVRVYCIWRSSAALGVRVDFVVTTSAEEQKTSILLEPDQRQSTIALPFDAKGGTRYRYEAKLLTPGGDTLLSAGEMEARNLVLVVPRGV
jgi:hypothetical protein